MGMPAAIELWKFLYILCKKLKVKSKSWKEDCSLEKAMTLKDNNLALDNLIWEEVNLVS